MLIGYITKDDLSRLQDPEWQARRNDSSVTLWTTDGPPSRAIVPVFLAEARQSDEQEESAQPEAREALRLDAERYRWLRDPGRCVDDDLDLIVGQSGGEDVFWREQLDKAIDNARRLNRIADPDFWAALSQGAQENRNA